MNLTLAAAIVIIASCFSLARAGQQRVGKLSAKVTIDVKMDYLLFVPREYEQDPQKKWPLMIFLHGVGERGSDVSKVKQHGPPKVVERNPDFPFILVSPQCPEHRWWEPAVINALIERVMADHRVDHDRVYLTGLSMGGYGTWATAAAYPDRFAAILPICGGGEPATAPQISHIPAWVFHGEKDKVVPIERSEAMVNALKEAGGDVKFTRYPDATHDSWTKTYDNPEVYDWLLSHKRKPVQEHKSE
jgi:predicted peptidase